MSSFELEQYQVQWSAAFDRRPRKLGCGLTFVGCELGRVPNLNLLYAAGRGRKHSQNVTPFDHGFFLKEAVKTWKQNGEEGQTKKHVGRSVIHPSFFGGPHVFHHFYGPDGRSLPLVRIHVSPSRFFFIPIHSTALNFGMQQIQWPKIFSLSNKGHPPWCRSSPFLFGHPKRYTHLWLNPQHPEVLAVEFQSRGWDPNKNNEVFSWYVACMMKMIFSMSASFSLKYCFFLNIFS